MRLSIKRADLARVLTNQNKIIESRNTIPILSMAKLSASPDRLTITMTDLDVEVKISAPATVEKSGEVCVSADLMEQIAKKAGGDEILLALKKDDATGGGTLAVTSGRSKFNVQTLPAEDFPAIDGGAFPVEFEYDLAGLFSPVKFAISTEETRYYLNGIYLHVKDGNLVAVATDGHRLSRNIGAAVPASPDFDGVIIPRKTIGLLPTGVVAVALSNTKIRITAGDTVITSKLIDGAFPDYQRVIPTGNDKLATIDNAALRQAVDRVSVVSSERARAVKLSFGPDSLALSVRGDGDANDELAASYDADPVEIGFNSAYLAALLGNLPAGEVTVALADSGSPTLFTSKDAEGLLCVLMPMRV